jgi:predicted permease
MTLQKFFQRRRQDADRARELEAHLALETDRNLARGFAPAEARRLAHVRFGNSTLVRETARARPLDGLLQDARYTWRQIHQAPTFAVVTMLTIALGMGANTAIFSTVHVALLKLLPVPGADRLVFLHTTDSIQAQSGYGNTSLTDHIFESLRTDRRVFTNLVAFAPLSGDPVSVRYGDGSAAEEAVVELVSGDFFAGLGVAPALGRVLTRDDEATHAAVAVLRYEYWARRFDRSPAVLGSTVTIKGEPFVIVGIAGPAFAGAEREKTSDVWIPLQTRAILQPWDEGNLTIYGTSPRWWCLVVIGRLAPGVTPAQAAALAGPVFERAALDGITRQLPADQVPHLYLTPVRGIDGMQEDFGQPLGALEGMVAVVLVMACLNVGTLLVVRGTARSREFALRLALGAGRRRLARQLFVESAVLVAGGTGLGWAFAVWATRALASWAGLNLDFAPDATVLSATLAVSVIVTVGFALAPLTIVRRLDPTAALKTWGTAAASGPSHSRLRELVLSAQIALCLVLLVGGSLLVRSLGNLERVDLGLRPSNLVVFGINPPTARSDAEAIAFFETLLGRLRAAPGVDAVTLLGKRPGSGWSSNSALRLDGAAPLSNAQLRYNVAGSDLVRVLGATLLAGRDLAESDHATAPKVALINETLAQKYFGGLRALGHTISSMSGPPRTIVGIIADMKYTATTEDARPMAWYPYVQTTGLRATMQVEVRSAIPMGALMRVLRTTVGTLAPEAALLQPMTEAEQFARSYSQTALASRLATWFGVLAALLVATGLYGTLAYAVSRRTAEIGVRMALGARRGQVVWAVLRRTLLSVGVGLALGLVLARVAASFLGSMLYGVRATDPMVFLVAVLALVSCAALASWIPAARASAIDPVTAVRRE